ncbi:hypothetical protein [Glaciecola sp. KUL10]|uniref:hypothetical protein n=1 Tax=Glaciecola sp. (strain KUL10) TaxID=2161813 RepID=UPI000D782BBB|nr:hypothetical protein [Glaciecola sp. KUL10]GBL02957.1 RNA polymerase sigma factor, sigma-70 family [Glaciecola sp. KUL10]
MAVKKPDVDIALAALVKHARPGQTLSIREIAEVCGCNTALLTNIERSARRKALKICERKGMADFLQEEHSIAINAVDLLSGI